VEEAKEAPEQVEEQLSEDGGGNGGGAKRFLIPAAAGVGTLAATLAARKAPELFRDHVKPKLEQQGGEEAAKVGEQAASRLQGQGGVVGALASRATEKLGAAGGREKTRRLPIQRWTDVAVPVDVAYEKWTEFEEFPKFMHRVVSVEKKDDKTIAWQEKIWFSRRQWEAEITDRRKNDRIAWKTTEGMSHAGVVSFHKLDTNLTRVLVEMDFRPNGMIEKMASGLRFVKRAVEADLARFKAYVEMDDAKGLEYTQPKKGEEEQKDAEQEGSAAQQEDSSNGRGDASQARQQTDEELEKSRRERAERREERRT
jgi:uncharacterized membrane protein